MCKSSVHRVHVVVCGFFTCKQKPTYLYCKIGTDLSQTLYCSRYTLLLCIWLKPPCDRLLLKLVRKDFETFLQLYPDLQQILNQEKTENNNKFKKEHQKHNDSCNFNHKELKNYIYESNPCFSKRAYYLNRKMCSGKCKGLFDEINKGLVVEQLWIKSSVNAPVWVC